jgi:hypothetical protein
VAGKGGQLFVTNDEEGRRRRFENKFIRGKGDECWLWKTNTVLPQPNYNPNPWWTIKAYEFAYHIYMGPVPSGMKVVPCSRHKKCVNPFHLEVVDAEDTIES